MARPLILSAGSRGDIEPLIALASYMQRDGGLFFVQKEYLHLTECISEEEFKCVPLPFCMNDMWPSFGYATKLAREGLHDFFVTWRACGHVMGNLVVPALDEVLKSAKESKVNCVLSTTLTWPIAHAIAEVMDIPLVLLTFQADIRSKYAPHINTHPEKLADVALSRDFVPDEGNFRMYDGLHEICIPEYLAAINEKRASLGLKQISDTEARNILDGAVPTIIGLSPNVVPVVPDYPDTVHVVGPLAANYLPPFYTPPDELVKFLDAGAPPILVSYGSLGTECDSKVLTRTVLTALEECAVSYSDNNDPRIIILPGRAGIDPKELDTDQDEHLRNWVDSASILTHRSNVQYAWLLPKVRLLLCHGGAGCTSAALNAGTPLVITPVFGDQRYYATWVRRSGLGAATSAEKGLAKLDASELAAAVTRAFGDDIAQNSTTFSKKERKLEPLAEVVQILNKLVKS